MILSIDQSLLIHLLGSATLYSKVNFDVTIYTVATETVYSKGTTKYSNVTSTSKTTYPNNNRQGSYWYVYKGVQ